MAHDDRAEDLPRPRSVNELLGLRTPDDAGGKLRRERVARTPIPLGAGGATDGPLAIAVAPSVAADPSLLRTLGAYLEHVLEQTGDPGAVRLRTGRGDGLHGLSTPEHLLALRLLHEGREVRLCPLRTHLTDRAWSLVVGARGLVTFEPVGVRDSELADIRRLAETLGVPVLHYLLPDGSPLLGS